MPGHHRHVVEPDRVDDDPQDGEEPEGSTLGSRHDGLARRHRVDDDRDEHRDEQRRQGSLPRADPEHSQQHEEGSSGSMATRAVRNIDPATASSTGRYIRSPPCDRWDGAALCSGAPGAGASRGAGVSRGAASGPEAGGGQGANGGIEHLHRVGEPEASALALDGRGDLHEAAGVGGHQQLGPGAQDVGGLAVAELAGSLRVEDVVDTGRAAAQRRPRRSPAAPDRVCRAAARAAAPGRPGRGRGGRSRGRRSPWAAGGARPPDPASARTSETSRTRSANDRARSAYRASSESRSAYSFIVEPHPAALTTTESTPSRSKVSISALAKRWASAARPLCAERAPQQPCAAGAITSKPSAERTRVVAALTPGKNSRCTQPSSIPTVPRRGPLAGVRSGTLSGRLSGGARASMEARVGEMRCSTTVLRRSRDSPLIWCRRSGPRIARSRLGYGNNAKIAARSARSDLVRVEPALHLAAGRLDELVVPHT